MAGITTSPQVSSLAETGGTQVTGDVTLTEGTNVTITQSGNDFTIAASGAGGGEWTDTGTLLHPADLSGAEDVAVGGTTTTAPIVLAGVSPAGQAKFEPTASISAPPYAVIVAAEATTNKCTNPSFEVDTAGWANTASSTISKDSTAGKFHSGTSGCKVIVSGGAGNEGISFTGISTSSSATESCSVWICGNSGGELVKLVITETTGGAGVTSQNITLTTTPKRYPITRAMGVGVSVYKFEVLTQGATTPTFWIDDAQFEQKAYATAFCHGGMGLGHSWAGTPHASNSSRVAGTFVLAPLTANSGNDLVVKPDGSIGAMKYKFYAEGLDHVRYTTWPQFDFVGAKLSDIYTLGGKESVMRIYNEANGCVLIVDGSAVTTQQVLHLDGSAITSGTIFSVGAPTNRTNFTGYYQKYFDKNSAANVDHAWTKNLYQIGTDGIPDRKYLWLHGGGKHNSTKTAQASTVHTSGASSTTVVSPGTPFLSTMVGRIMRANNTDRRITAFTSTSQVTVDTAVNWGSAPGFSWELYDSQYEPNMLWMEGPNGDHIYADTADYLNGLGFTGSRRLFIKQPTSVDTITWPTSDTDSYLVPHATYREATTAGPNASAAETSLFTSAPTIKADTLGSNGWIEVKAFGRLKVSNTTHTVTFKMKLGATTILTSQAEAINNTSEFSFCLTAWIASVSATSQRNYLSVSANREASGATLEPWEVYETSAVDMSSDRVFDITATISTASTNYVELDAKIVGFL